MESCFPKLLEELKYWEITEELGSGSYGKVYAAEKVSEDWDEENEEEERDVSELAAIKVVHIPRSDEELKRCLSTAKTQEERIRWFQPIIDKTLEEVKILQSLGDCENIVKVYEYGIQSDPEHLSWDIFYSMEMLETLEYYQTYHTVDEKTFVKIGIDICNALMAMDERHLIHRDIKPGNILVDRNGNFKLSDFGTARIIMDDVTMSMAGTKPYEAPEITHRIRYGKTVDIYSLGITLYTLLNDGLYPFLEPKGGEPYTEQEIEDAIGRRHLGENFPGPKNASATLQRIILKACAWEPGDRYKNAAQFKQTLEEYRDGKRISVKLPVYKEGNRRIQIKKRMIAGISALVLGSAVAGYFGVNYYVNRDTILASKVQTEISEKAERVDDVFEPVTMNITTPTAEGGDQIKAAIKEDYQKNHPEYEQVESFLIYADDTLCIGQVVGYNVTIKDRADYSTVDSNYVRYAFQRTDTGWESISFNSVDRETRIGAIANFMPEGLMDAIASGRRHYETDGMFYTGVFKGVMNTDILAAWENEDGSVDMLYAIRNGTDEPGTATAYLLDLFDQDGGDIIAAKGKCLIQVEAGETGYYQAHFEKEYVNDIPWNEVYQTSTVYNDQTDWF